MAITVSNVVEAVFSGCRETVTRALNQYDYGQVLTISGIELPEAYEVHFSNASIGSATTSIGNAVGVTIPDQYLTTGKDVHAWIYLHAGEEDGETLYHIRIPVIRRARAMDADPTPAQQSAINQAIAALNVAVIKTRNCVEDALTAEGWAKGTRWGTPVDESSPYYHTNATYMAGQAADSATAAAGSAGDASDSAGAAAGSARDASDSAGAASGSAAAAAADALEAEGWAKGTQNGSAVASGSPYYQDNSKYFKEQAASSATAAETAAASATAAYGTTLLAPTYSTSGTYAVGDYCIYNGNMYRCTTAIPSGESWTSGHWTQVAVGSEVGSLKSAINSLDRKSEEVFSMEPVTVFDRDISGTKVVTITGLDIAPGEYFFHIDSITSEDTDETVSHVDFIRKTGQTEAEENFSRTTDINRTYTFKNAIGSIRFYAAKYNTSEGDAFEYEGVTLKHYIDITKAIITNKENMAKERGVIWFENQAGYYHTNGTYSAYYKSSYTDIIPCSPGEKFLYTGGCASSTAASVIYYLDGVHVSNAHYDLGTTVEVTVPASVNGVRFQCQYQNTNDIILEHSAYRTSPKSADCLAKELQDANALIQKNDAKSVLFTTESKDLLKDVNLYLGCAIDGTTGAIQYFSTSAASDFIPVTPGEVFLKQNVSELHWYDSSKAKVTGSSNTAPQDAHYLRVKINLSVLDNAVLTRAQNWRRVDINNVLYNSATDALVNHAENVAYRYAEKNTGNFEESENLFDYTKDYLQLGGNKLTANGFDYSNDPNQGFTNNQALASDKYFPVTPGHILCCNYYIGYAFWYDENYGYVSSTSYAVYPNKGRKVPDGCYYVRLSFGATGNKTAYPDQIGSWDEIKNIVVKTINYNGDNVYTSWSRPRLPKYRINGDMISDNLLDTIVPSMADSEFVSAMRCMAVREVNAREHAYRFGTFNMYVMNHQIGWKMTKKMLMDYGIDFCGFQEVHTGGATEQYTISRYLKSWQFADGFVPERTGGTTDFDKSFVSRFPITSSEELEFQPEDVVYLNCKMQLPRYMDVLNPKRMLSVYVVHLPITNDSGKASLASQLLSVIAEDSSDFVVVMGDTNDFGDTAEDKAFWQAMIAGGYTPAIPAIGKTITQDVLSGDDQWVKNSIDQIFVSSNIEVLNYNIVNTKEGYGVSTCVKIDGDECLSDHDFVFADLRFKYDEQRSDYPVSSGD